ncbi:MAG TPA: DUF3943 domain-containing protein [Gemmatimonadales bacterium]|nr:DUF3943 domain-containing protein [Gemmatimonadales bacterium]
MAPPRSRFIVPGPSTSSLRLAARSPGAHTISFACRSGALALAAAALVAVPEPASSQARQPEWASLSLPGDTLVPASATTSVLEQACPDCNPPKRFWAGAGELMVVQFIPWAFTKYVTKGEWSNISPRTWADNLKFPWQWDNNKFNNNQFAHPYHGSLYFNTGRSNGYNFWQSAPWAFGGSLMWELFGEVWAPAPNDLANTTLGGITLGEMLFRFSSLTLDNQATGSNRVVREIGAGLINPVRGFNRLVRGETGRISENPPDWRPSVIQASMDVGYRRFATSGSLDDPNARDQAFVQFSVFYGNQIADLDREPFSSFQVTGALASRSANHKALQELRVRGNLAAKRLGSSEQKRLAAFMTYEYISNPVVDFGAQGFQGGLVYAQAKPGKQMRLSGEALARFNPIAAIRSDYFVTAEGRDYDYGVGLGGRLAGQALWPGKATVQLSGGYIFLPVVSGFPGSHQLWTLSTEARGYFRGKFGAGVVYNRLWRRSNYTFNADVHQDMSEARVFLSLAIPRWEE